MVPQPRHLVLSAPLSSETIHDRLLAIPVERRVALFRRCAKLRALHDSSVDDPIFFPVAIASPPDQGDDAIGIVIALLCRLEELADREPTVMRDLVAALEAGSARFASLPSREGTLERRDRFRRPDVHPGERGFRVLEINQIAPQGSDDCDVEQAIARELVEALGVEYAPRMIVPQLVEWLVESPREIGRPLAQCIAIVSEVGFPASHAHDGLARDCERASKQLYGDAVSFIAVYPHEVSRRGNVAVARGRDIDVIWLNYLDMSALARRNIDDAPLVDAISNATRTRVVNGTRSLLSGSKAALAMLWDSDVQHGLKASAEEIAVLRALLPRTISALRNAGALREAREARARWISKPADLCEGQGAVLGSDVDDESWGRLVEDRSTPAWVFQERVDPGRASAVELQADGHARVVELDCVWGPYFLRGRFAGTGDLRAHVRTENTRPRVLGRGSGYVSLAAQQITVPSSAVRPDAGSLSRFRLQE